MRTATLIAGSVLVLGGLAGCGSSDSGGGDAAASSGMPTNASKADFCGNFQSLATDLAKLDPQADAATAVKALKDAVANMRDTGTPDGIPDDAQHGLEVTLDAIDGLPDDATTDDISGLESTLSDAEQKDATAFDSYLKDECGSLQ